MRKLLAIALAALLLLAAACSSTSGSSSVDEQSSSVDEQSSSVDEQSSSVDEQSSSVDELSVAYKLAVVDGDPSEEGAFQDVIDCIMASGIEGAETEEKVGDTLVASWQQAGKPGSLLDWAQALC